MDADQILQWAVRKASLLSWQTFLIYNMSTESASCAASLHLSAHIQLACSMQPCLLHYETKLPQPGKASLHVTTALPCLRDWDSRRLL